MFDRDVDPLSDLSDSEGATEATPCIRKNSGR